MSDLVLVDGDLAMFVPAFGAATVAVRPGTISGSAPVAIGGKHACIAGDEASVTVAGCVYLTPQFTVPGAGDLTIAALGGDGEAATAKAGGAPLLLKGGSFTARFSVRTPAMQPPPGPGPLVPDPAPGYSGQGTFVPANLLVKAS